MHRFIGSVAAGGTVFVLVAGMFTLPELLRALRTPTPAGESEATWRSLSTPASGSAVITDVEGFSFTAANTVPQGGDLQYVEIPRPTFYAPGGLLPLGYDDLEKVKTVPRASSSLLGSNYRHRAEFLVGQCYAVLCADGQHYAKVRVVSIQYEPDGPRVSFDWVLQANRTPNF